MYKIYPKVAKNYYKKMVSSSDCVQQYLYDINNTIFLNLIIQKFRFNVIKFNFFTRHGSKQKSQASAYYQDNKVW